MGRIRKENARLKEENRKLRNEMNGMYQKLAELDEIRRQSRERFDDLASTIEEAADMCLGSLYLINQETEKIRNIILNMKGEEENG